MPQDILLQFQTCRDGALEFSTPMPEETMPREAKIQIERLKGKAEKLSAVRKTTRAWDTRSTLNGESGGPGAGAEQFSMRNMTDSEQTGRG
jgi:hypothetical protein